MPFAEKEWKGWIMKLLIANGQQATDALELNAALGISGLLSRKQTFRDTGE